MGKRYTLKFEYEMDIVLDSIDMDCVYDAKEYAKSLLIEELGYIFNHDSEDDLIEFVKTIDINEISDKEIKDSYM